MIEIRLYKPRRLDIKLTLPENWNELNNVELELIAALMQSDMSDKTKQQSVLFSGLLKAAAERSGQKTPKNILSQLDAEQVVCEIFPLLEWVFNSNTLTEQPYSSIKLPGLLASTVYGPLSDFDNLSVGEYEDAEEYFFDFSETGNLKALANMCALLYRPKGHDYFSFKNQKPKTYDYSKIVRFFQKLPKEKLLSIWLWFTGCRNMLTLYFPFVFSGNGEKVKADKLSFTRCIHAGAGAKNGTRQQVRLLPIKEFFFDMNEEAKAANEIKNSQKK